MSTSAATAVPAAPPRVRRRTTSAGRVAALARAEAVALLRQRSTLLTVLLGPFLVVVLAVAQRGAPAAAWTHLLSTALPTLLMLVVHFPVLVVVVSRRETRVLARLRTSELSPAELVAGTALPLAAVGAASAALTCGLYRLLGGVAPAGAWPVLGIALAIAGMLAAAMAVATATASAESANWTAMPLVLVVTVAGQVLLAGAGGAELRTAALLLPFASLPDLLARTSSAPLEVPATALPGSPELVDVLLLAAWTALAALVAHRRWRWGPRD